MCASTENNAGGKFLVSTRASASLAQYAALLALVLVQKHISWASTLKAMSTAHVVHVRPVPIKKEENVVYRHPGHDPYRPFV